MVQGIHRKRKWWKEPTIPLRMERKACQCFWNTINRISQFVSFCGVCCHHIFRHSFIHWRDLLDFIEDNLSLLLLQWPIWWCNVSCVELDQIIKVLLHVFIHPWGALSYHFLDSVICELRNNQFTGGCNCKLLVRYYNVCCLDGIISAFCLEFMHFVKGVNNLW